MHLDITVLLGGQAEPAAEAAAAATAEAEAGSAAARLAADELARREGLQRLWEAQGASEDEDAQDEQGQGGTAQARAPPGAQSAPRRRDASATAQAARR